MAPDPPLASDAPKPPRKPRTNAIAAAAVGALVAAFAVLNSQSVEVNWILTTTRTPLIVVILLFLAVGMLGGVIAGSGRRAGRRGKR